MTPVNNGMITYTALGGEPRRGFGHIPFSGIIPLPPATPTYTAGETVYMWLDYGYTKLDKSVKDIAHTSNTVSGQSDTLYFGSTVTWHMQFDAISDVREIGFTEEAAAFDAMIDSALRGQVLTWYPSWTGSGNDVSFQCALRKRTDPTRIGGDIHLWSFTLDLEVLPTMTIPAVPVFV
ncbi:MAG: hypothetical protein Q9M13_04280 [Mariprofundales bacterium]|nr:hypothetical protein [Mariprofundales bacterium]